MLILERVSILFLLHRKNMQKNSMSEEFQFFDNYEDYIMNYLTEIESESDDVLDALSQKYKLSFFISSINI